MPIHLDSPGRRRVEMYFDTPGTPQQVWAAMATGPGNAAWFARATIEERVGGLLRFDFMPGMSSQGEVTAWDPPRRFAYVEPEWEPGAPPIETEITIRPGDGPGCAVRMTHTIRTDSSRWDASLQNFEDNWPGFFKVLRHYLANFADRPAASFQVMTQTSDALEAVWNRMTGALGLVDAKAGEKRRVTGPQVLSGTVEEVRQDASQHFVMLFLDQPVGVAWVGSWRGAGSPVTASAAFYFYGANAQDTVATAESAWQDWLAETAAKR